MEKVFLSLGSNLGDRKAQILHAMREIGARIGKIKKKSPIYETEPWGYKDQAWFLNCCVQIETKLAPKEIFSECLKIESEMGRPLRHEKWGPRQIDMDILFYGDTELKSTKPRLTIPHPEICSRRFILTALAQIAPNFRHPVFKKTMKELLKECLDTSIVKPLMSS